MCADDTPLTRHEGHASPTDATGLSTTEIVMDPRELSSSEVSAPSSLSCKDLCRTQGLDCENETEEEECEQLWSYFCVLLKKTVLNRLAYDVNHPLTKLEYMVNKI